MSETRKGPSELGREVATTLMLRQLYVILSNQMEVGSDGLQAWQADLTARLKHFEPSGPEADREYEEVREAAIVAINEVFEPLIDEDPHANGQPLA